MEFPRELTKIDQLMAIANQQWLGAEKLYSREDPDANALYQQAFENYKLCYYGLQQLTTYSHHPELLFSYFEIIGNAAMDMGADYFNIAFIAYNQATAIYDLYSNKMNIDDITTRIHDIKTNINVCTQKLPTPTPMDPVSSYYFISLLCMNTSHDYHHRISQEIDDHPLSDEPLKTPPPIEGSKPFPPPEKPLINSLPPALPYPMFDAHPTPVTNTEHTIAPTPPEYQVCTTKAQGSEFKKRKLSKSQELKVVGIQHEWHKEKHPTKDNTKLLNITFTVEVEKSWNKL